MNPYDFIKIWCAKYRELRKTRYMVQGWELGGVKQILTYYTPQQIQGMLNYFWENKDYIKPNCSETINSFKFLIPDIIRKMQEESIWVFTEGSDNEQPK